MKKGLTELVFILDRSGSMCGLEGDTIGGFNSILAKQKKEEGEAVITTVLFDDKYELLHNGVNIKDVIPITDKEYYVRGTTALLDAIGRTINKVVNEQKNKSEDERAEHVLFVIITDGMENASQEYTFDKVRQMIEYQKTNYGWEFIFLGANIDAISTAARFGIGQDRAANYNADKEGVLLNYQVINETVSCLRTSHKIADNWKERIEKDFKRRRK
ncbi:MAG: hypothetical protein JG776_1135 [Caloramator sp.]|jgi:uncharacterized protein YegL|uniref:vWA domain-containing protein n=1 Tax=Caloramator sp. TaxID=1871330 RepID=UPI001D7B51D0|nr:vWA domain-containing protein [Caloramator sp.]MBZ4663433.1 hypothetical protein [Caloramator sp.]